MASSMIVPVLTPGAHPDPALFINTILLVCIPYQKRPSLHTRTYTCSYNSKGRAVSLLAGP